jgi:hypothetical protein
LARQRARLSPGYLRGTFRDPFIARTEQNAFLKTHYWEEYAAWHLGLTEGAAEERKARYAFVYGDFRHLHHMGLIACHYRAAEWGPKEIELAAHELLGISTKRAPHDSAAARAWAPLKKGVFGVPSWSRWKATNSRRRMGRRSFALAAQ